MHWFILLPIFAAALWSAFRTVVLVATDGYGDVPPPRSHDHEPMPAWRAA